MAAKSTPSSVLNDAGVAAAKEDRLGTLAFNFHDALVLLSGAFTCCYQ